MHEDDFNSVLERSSKLKASMQTLEANLSQTKFSAKVEGVQYACSGDGVPIEIILDPELQSLPAQLVVPALLRALQKTQEKIERSRADSFRSIVTSLQST